MASGKTKAKKKKKTKKTRKTLVIVESPAKARTINKYLGDAYIVSSSMGHLIDLPKSRMAVDVDNDFTPDYITVRGRGKILDSLKRLAAQAKEVLLAADDDREGESITFHLQNAIHKHTPDVPIKRIVFHEITPDAIRKAVSEPGEINMDKVNAQKARRILDRLVGYSLSPLLWEKIKRGLSAGRVQSVALKLICDREAEIKKFKPVEYWELEAELIRGKKLFKAKLSKVGGEKAVVNNGEDAKALVEEFSKEKFRISEATQVIRRRNPVAALTTSRLQQEAANKLSYTSAKTMVIAQQLYEGVDLKTETVGLVSYIRTDSVRISDLALGEVRAFITSEYGKEYLPEKPNTYKNRKQVQDAHEAIRPTSIIRTPDSVKQYLTRDQLKLYTLIWERMVSSQMTPMQYKQISVVIEAGRSNWRASGQKVVFDGFTRAIHTGKRAAKEGQIAEMKKGEELELTEIEPSQHFTAAPPRFSDASIVKVLEESGIGRPSTYVPIIETLVKRYYITRNQRQFKPTVLGDLTNDFLSRHFSGLLNLEFTANMEEKLDGVEIDHADWVSMIREFYGPFHENVDHVSATAKSVKGILDIPTDEVCEKCGLNMVKRVGRFGYFLACPGFPKCRNTRALPVGECPRDECKGELVLKKVKGRKKFYGCTEYPDCDFITWDTPLNEKCPLCGKVLLEKSSRKQSLAYCSSKECDYKRTS